MVRPARGGVNALARVARRAAFALDARGPLLFYGPMAPLLGPAAQKLGELASSAAAPAAVAHLRALLSGGDDFDCYKVNAFRVAAEIGLPRADVLRALLFATRLGIFDLSWDVRCPSCTGTPEYHRTLMRLARSAHCGLCELRWDIDFDEQVEVTFTANADVRPLAVREFQELGFQERVEHFRRVNAREGRGAHARAMCQPGETATIDVALQPGLYRYEIAGRPEVGGALNVADAPSRADQAATLTVGADGSLDVRSLDLAPGSVRLTIHSRYGRHWPLLVHRHGAPNNWVSAAYVTAQQDFRDLFSGEFLAPGVSFAVRSSTLMFTDIRGSTELYERLGDAAAYALVQEHFLLMTDEIRRHEGGIVKTIGDAVMAAFPVNADAVRAALAIQAGFGAHAARLQGIEVKIGLHRGPAIAVTSNRSLDYFGRTVNVAARVQGQSRPRGVLLSEAVLGDPAVRALIEERGLSVERFEAQLKGIAGPMTLASVAPP
jgi:adenylate cyclase